MNDTNANCVVNEDALTDDLFQKLPVSEKDGDLIARPSKSFWQSALTRFCANPFAVIGFFIILFLCFVSVFGPLFSSYTYDAQNILNQDKFPTWQHLFGTDKFGRDIFIRVLYGTRISLIIGFATAVINCIFGIVIGGVAGYFGGTIDMIVMRVMDILTSIPSMLYMILIMVIFGNSVSSIMLALCITYWISTARIVRSQVLTLKSEEYVLAARVLGASNKRILFKHLVPNSIGPIIVTVSYIIPSAIFAEAFLSFIGIGIQVPQASLGTLINDAIGKMFSCPYQMIFPVVVICVMMFALNFICDGLRDAFDTKLNH